MLEHVLTDRMHQVRLAKSHAAVDEQRVVRARRRFGDRAARGMRELIRRPDDERVEGVARIETARERTGSAISGDSSTAGSRRPRPGRRRRRRAAPSATNSSATPGRRTSPSASFRTTE